MFIGAVLYKLLWVDIDMAYGCGYAQIHNLSTLSSAERLTFDRLKFIGGIIVPSTSLSLIDYIHIRHG